MDKQLVVTSIEQLADYSRGTVVELPPFGPDQPFIARLRRPSLMALAKTGKIPNTLLNSANKMFFGDKSTSTKRYDENSLGEVFQIVDILCEAAFIEPSYNEIKRAGIELSDDQYMFVFNFTQQGVNALHSFRGKQGDTEDPTTVQSV